MYPWITHTWNPIKGRCPHQCTYCYMRHKPVGELRLDGKALNDDLGSDRTIFVGSSTDMWADEVPRIWINEVMMRIVENSGNHYVFQTKNPYGFTGWVHEGDYVLGVTLESNRDYEISQAPCIAVRVSDLRHLCGHCLGKPQIFISIEPILDFDINTLIEIITHISPDFVTIGADSKKTRLPEPSPEKIHDLVTTLQTFMDVRLKPNLKRLYQWG